MRGGSEGGVNVPPHWEVCVGCVVGGGIWVRERGWDAWKVAQGGAGEVWSGRCGVGGVDGGVDQELSSFDNSLAILVFVFRTRAGVYFGAEKIIILTL